MSRTLKAYLILACFALTPLLAAAQAESAQLFSAIKHNEHKAVVQMISSLKDVNVRDEKGFTPLHYAAREGHVDLVKLLMSYGADLNARNEDEWTPLHKASLHGHVEVIKLLLAGGADVNAADPIGITPLYLASAHNHTEAIAVLEAAGGKK